MAAPRGQGLCLVRPVSPARRAVAGTAWSLNKRGECVNGAHDITSFLNIFLLICLLCMTFKNDKAVIFGDKYKNFFVIEMTSNLVESVYKRPEHIRSLKL